jgi:hypothetical protein
MSEYTITISGSHVELNKEQMPEEVAIQLENVARMIREGYTTGHYPAWDLTIKEQ